MILRPILLTLLLLQPGLLSLMLIGILSILVVHTIAPIEKLGCGPKTRFVLLKIALAVWNLGRIPELFAFKEPINLGVQY